MLRNEVRCKIVTIVVVFAIRQNGSLQQQVSMKAGKWCDMVLSQDQTRRVKFIDQDEQVRKLHNEHLFAFVEQQLMVVLTEQQQHLDPDSFTDQVAELVDKEQRALAYKK